MDIMDIQAVESKLSDVTVTPIPRSQVQNFYNYQQQREQREQQPQIQISAIHHTPRERHQTGHHSNTNERDAGGRDLYNLTKRERDYHHQLNNVVTNSNTSAAVAVAALQYTQKLQAQLALLQQQANNSVGTTPSITLTPASSMRSNNSISNSNSNQNSSNQIGQHPLQLKYPQSSSPVIITTQTSANITTPMTSTANLPTVGATGVNNGLSKYAQLLAVIEEMGRDIRPTYTGSRTSTERLKRGIVHARILVRECLMETERSARQ
uniref:Cyclin-dependent kinase 2-associated protein n=2 Tax=Glossina TaxID=44049 RepID=A0A1A9UUD5_GLOAU